MVQHEVLGVFHKIRCDGVKSYLITECKDLMNPLLVHVVVEHMAPHSSYLMHSCTNVWQNEESIAAEQAVYVQSNLFL